MTSQPETRRRRGRSARASLSGRSAVENAVTWLGVASVAVAVLGLGAVHVQVAQVAGTGMLVAAVGALALGARIPLAAAVALGAAAYTALQALPLPAVWVQSVSPSSALIWLRATSLVAPELSNTAHLSIAPAASWFEAFKWWVYGAAFIAGGFIGERRGARFGASVIFATAVAAAFVTLVHGVSGLERVYGVYTPVLVRPAWPTGPLLNPNNFAGYMNLGAFCGLGLLLSRRPALVSKTALGFAVVFVLGCMLVSTSRGAVAALVLGVLTYLGVSLRRRALSRKKVGTAIVVLGVLVAGGLLAAVAWSDEMTSLMVSGDVSKAELWGWTVPLIRDFPATGSGRGSFDAAFGPYRQTPGHVAYSSVENFPLQFMAEWGPAVGTSVLVLFALALRPSRMVRTGASLGAYVGFIALIAQNLVDLSLELMGISMALAFLLGTCVGDVKRVSASKPKAVLRAAIFAGTSLTLVLLVGVFAVNAAAEARRLHAHFDEELSGRDAERFKDIRAMLREAILRSPGSAYPFVLGAVAALRAHEQPMAWIARAIERDPLNGRAHVVAAQVMQARGASAQALFHLRLASEYEPGLAPLLATLAIGWTNEFARLLLAVPAGQSGIPLLLAMANRLGPEQSELRERILRAVIERDANQIEASEALSVQLMRSLEASTSRCGAERSVECRNDVSTLADRLRRQAPKSPAWLLLKARLFLLDRRWNEADQLLAEHCPRVHPQFACAELRLETSLESGAPAVHQQAILNLREVCGAPESCAMAEKAIADLYVERGWLREALGPLRRGAELLPSVDNWLGVAELAVRLGSRGEAERAMRRALEVNPGDSVARRVKEIRDRLAVQAPRE